MLESITFNQQSGRLERKPISQEASRALAIITLYHRAMKRHDGSSVDPTVLALLQNESSRVDIVRYFCEMPSDAHPTPLLLFIISDIARHNGITTTQERLDALRQAIDQDRASRQMLRNAEEHILAIQDSLSPSMLDKFALTMEAAEAEANKAFLRSLGTMMSILSP